MSKMNLFDNALSQDIWNSKYRAGEEKSVADSMLRVVNGIYGTELTISHFEGIVNPFTYGDPEYKAFNCLREMYEGRWNPGGRIHAGAGTGNRVTLHNCYVLNTVEDSMEGIANVLKEGMLTMQQGGGIGTDFSTLRPSGAHLERTNAVASGPLPFMDMWDSMCRTIMSAGARRGAMMGTLSDTHPDLLEFIKAKHTAGRLTNFNVSILVSDAFMDAVKNDETWHLHFNVPPHKDGRADKSCRKFVDEEGEVQYIYSEHKASELWKLILESTYEYSEPGVIFIDRVNELNNLQYCEDIRATNPCVTGNTRILTREYGYKEIGDIAGQEVSVWNGDDWSKVTPHKTGEAFELQRVWFSNGSVLDVTPYHRFKLSNGKVVEAKDLKVKDKLVYWNMPFIGESLVKEEDEWQTDPYSQGFWEGDGSIGEKTGPNCSTLCKHSDAIKERLIGEIRLYNNNTSDTQEKRVVWVHGDMEFPLKGNVPINQSADYCVKWLAGLLDADGNIKHSGANTSGGGTYQLELSQKSKRFLWDVQLMLTRLGCTARVWQAEEAGTKVFPNGKEYAHSATYRLMINKGNVVKLKELGLDCARVDLSVFTPNKGNYGAWVGHRVIDIEERTGEPQDVYCFTEPVNNMGLFEGIPTMNCGEIPLPPNGTCNLGAVNLAVMVEDPFSPNAKFKFDELEHAVRVGMDFLDRVIDVTNYPLDSQKEEEFNKRRTGLGITGLADALCQLGIRYGSREAVTWTRNTMRKIAEFAYDESVNMAIERGKFPLYDNAILERPFIQQLSSELQKSIAENGLRNGVLLTAAPTGTTSIYYGNVSSGIEPTFAHKFKRRVLQPDGAHKEYMVESYIARLWRELKGNEPYPDYFVTTDELKVEEHVEMQAAAQEWIDASISKTVNCPKDMTFEEFQRVYDLAYILGCKGITTYRPSDTRGAVLINEGDGGPLGTDVGARETGEERRALLERPTILEGKTHRLRWPTQEASIYMTVNRHPTTGRPYEVFFQSRDARNQEWMTAVSLMISSVLRLNVDPSFIPRELKQISSAHDSNWVEGALHASLPAYLGYALAQHFNAAPTDSTDPTDSTSASQCPKCHSMTFLREEGCMICKTCGHSVCG